MPKVSLTKEECYCGIAELYDIIATKLGYNPALVCYNCRKVCVSQPVISELMDSILNNPQDPVEDTTYKFALKLLSFEVVSTNASMRRVFHIAADFIDKEVIGLFRTKEGMYP